MGCGPVKELDPTGRPKVPTGRTAKFTDHYKLSRRISKSKFVVYNY